jgi:hypothetical protein
MMHHRTSERQFGWSDPWRFIEAAFGLDACGSKRSRDQIANVSAA